MLHEESLHRSRVERRGSIRLFRFTHDDAVPAIEGGSYATQQTGLLAPGEVDAADTELLPVTLGRQGQS